MQIFPKKFLEKIRLIETSLCQFYRIEFNPDVHDFLMNHHPIGENKNTKNTSPLRASVFVNQPLDSKELNLGVWFSPNIISQCDKFSTSQLMSLDCLDVFCVLVEELSHFHLLCSRASGGMKVSQLELEFQAEIDKFLICSLVLSSQKPVFRPDSLLGRLYDQVTILSDNSRYAFANRMAAKFWGGLGYESRGFAQLFDCDDFRRYMCGNYRRPLAEKRSYLDAGSTLISA